MEVLQYLETQMKNRLLITNSTPDRRDHRGKFGFSATYIFGGAFEFWIYLNCTWAGVPEAH